MYVTFTLEVYFHVYFKLSKDFPREIFVNSALQEFFGFESMNMLCFFLFNEPSVFTQTLINYITVEVLTGEVS